jgi:hypothetical protein
MSNKFKFFTTLTNEAELYYVHGLTLKQIELELNVKDLKPAMIEKSKAENEGLVSLADSAWRMYKSVKSREPALEMDWPWGKFVQWYFKQGQACFYCGLTLKQTVEFLQIQNQKPGDAHKRDNRGQSLELDRKDFNSKYVEGDCVLSCYACNNAKSDIFEAKEFAPIAEEMAQVVLNTINN